MSIATFKLLLLQIVLRDRLSKIAKINPGR